jgi:glycogen operon protein
VNALRLQQHRNFLATLLLSQGVPMIYMGDECGHTQRGNNNAYCHDEEWNYLSWDLDEEGRSMLRFTKAMIAFRKANPALRQSDFLTGRDQVGSGYPDISWHGVLPWKPDWTKSSRSLAFLLCGRHSEAAGGPAQFLYVALNMFHKPLDFALPVLPRGMSWHRFADTGLTSPDDIADPGAEPPLTNQKQYPLCEWAGGILVGK